MQDYQSDAETEALTEQVDIEACNSVENVWQNNLISLVTTAIAVGVSYLLVVGVVLIQA